MYSKESTQIKVTLWNLLSDFTICFFSIFMAVTNAKKPSAESFDQFLPRQQEENPLWKTKR